MKPSRETTAAPKQRRSRRPAVVPRALNRAEAAAYMGLSLSSFVVVAERLALRPIRYPGVERAYYDRAALDLAIDQRQVVEVMPTTMPTKAGGYGFERIAHGGKGPVNA